MGRFPSRQITESILQFEDDFLKVVTHYELNGHRHEQGTKVFDSESQENDKSGQDCDLKRKKINNPCVDTKKELTLIRIYIAPDSTKTLNMPIACLGVWIPIPLSISHFRYSLDVRAHRIKAQSRFRKTP